MTMTERTMTRHKVLLAYKPPFVKRGMLPEVSFLQQYLLDKKVNFFTDLNEQDQADEAILVTLKLFPKLRGMMKEGKKVYAFPFLDHENFSIKRGELRIDSVKFLNGCNAVLVETEGQERFLLKQGVLSPIVKVPFSVAMDQRTHTSKLEKSVFSRFYGINPQANAVMILGSLNNLSQAESLARIMPEVVFVFNDIGEGNPKKRWITEKLPNLYYETAIREELYRSGFVTINAMVVLDKWIMDPVIVLDAIASGVPILGVEMPLLSSMIMPKADYVLIDGTPTNIYETLVKLSSSPITDLSRVDIKNKMMLEEKDLLVKFLEK